MTKKLKNVLISHGYVFRSSMKKKNNEKSIFTKDGNEITINAIGGGIYVEYDEGANKNFMSVTTALVSDYLNVKPVKAIDFF